MKNTKCIIYYKYSYFTYYKSIYAMILLNKTDMQIVLHIIALDCDLSLHNNVMLLYTGDPDLQSEFGVGINADFIGLIGVCKE